MSADVVILGDVKADNRLVTPVQMLELAMAELKSGKEKATSAMVILLHTDGEAYASYVYRSNLSSSQEIALLEVRKAIATKYLLGEA